MDDQLVTFVSDEHDDLEKVRGTVGTDDQSSIGVLAQGVNEHRLFDGVEDVVVRDAVAASGRVYLHTGETVLRKSVVSAAGAELLVEAVEFDGFRVLRPAHARRRAKRRLHVQDALAICATRWNESPSSSPMSR